MVRFTWGPNANIYFSGFIKQQNSGSKYNSRAARFKRMQGFNDLHPMGCDAFEFPSDQYTVEVVLLDKKTSTAQLNGTLAPHEHVSANGTQIGNGLKPGVPWITCKQKDGHEPMKFRVLNFLLETSNSGMQLEQRWDKQWHSFSARTNQL
nr:leucine--tRNA ligase, chloroplastic/mitochondrial [Tanacetum cinerariifolium]